MFGPPGSHDDSDPFSTNLYVGNIHPEVRQQGAVSYCWGLFIAVLAWHCCVEPWVG